MTLPPIALMAADVEVAKGAGAMTFRHVRFIALAVALLVLLAVGSAFLSYDRTSPSNREPLSIAVVGDQYSAGLANSATWPTLMAQRTGWAVANFAVPFAGYDASGTDGSTFASQIDRAMAADPDVIVIVGGSADFRSTDAAVNIAAREALKKVTLAGDTAMIVGPTWYQTPVSASVRSNADAVKKVADEAAVPYLDALDPPWLTTALMQPDLRAPSDAGQSVIADKIAQWLETEVQP